VAADARLTDATFGKVAALVSVLTAAERANPVEANEMTDAEIAAECFVSYLIEQDEQAEQATAALASIIARRGARTIVSVAALAARTDTANARCLFRAMFCPLAGPTKATVVRAATTRPDALAPHALDALLADGPSARLLAHLAVSGYIASTWARVDVERVLASDRSVATKAFWGADVLELIAHHAASPRASEIVRLIAAREPVLTSRSGLLPWACADAGRVRFLDALFDAGVRLAFTTDVEDAVSVACSRGNVAALRAMFRVSSARFVRHFNDARLAARLLVECDPAEFVAFAEETRLDVGLTFAGNRTLAVVAASTGNAAVLVYLLERGCDTTLVTEAKHEGLMHFVAKLDAPSLDEVASCVERLGSVAVTRSMLRELHKTDIFGAVPIEVCSRRAGVHTLSCFMRLCAALDRGGRVLLLFGFLAERAERAERADAEHIVGVARSLGYSAEEICGARTKDDKTDALGLAASRPDETLFGALVSLLVREGTANAALFRCDALIRLARRSPVAFASIYNDVVVHEARAALHTIDRASSLAGSAAAFVSEDPCFGPEVEADARRVVDRINARRRVHESYLNLSAARSLFPACALVVARSVESVIYGGEARDPVDGVEVFEFMLGIGAHEPHGFADFSGCPADYFAAVFAPCARRILESLRGTGLVARYVRGLCGAVHSTGPSASRNLEHVRIERTSATIQPGLLDAIFDRRDEDDRWEADEADRREADEADEADRREEDEADEADRREEDEADEADEADRWEEEDLLPRNVDYHSIADLRFAGEDASGPGQTREAIGVLWAQITADRDGFARTPGGLVPRPYACKRLMGLAGFIVGIAMRANIPLGLPHLAPSIAAVVVAPDPGFGAAVVAELFGADGVVLAAKDRSFEMSTEDCLSYCSPFNISERAGARIESAMGPTVTHATFASMCALVAGTVLGTPALEAMRLGFLRALCGTYTRGARHVASMLASSIFEPSDASLLFFGTSVVSVDRIRSKTRLVAGITDDAYESHETESLALFWDLFRTELSDEQRLMLFAFWTSNSSFPVHEAPDECYLISPLPVYNAPLFTASTCANHLRVPRYTDRATMLAKMIASLDSCGYMGLV
jgi:hypothetical protein